MKPAHVEDWSLAQRVLAKDRAAFDHFFTAYFGRLYRFVLPRIRDAAAVEDIVQESLLKALRFLGDYRGEASLLTWLCQISRHEIVDWHRKQARHHQQRVQVDDDPEVLAALESLQEAHEEDQLSIQKIVQLSLDHLPDNYGKALEWKYVEGLSVEEIAARLQLTAVAAQSLLARARDSFRRIVKDLDTALLTSNMGRKS